MKTETKLVRPPFLQHISIVVNDLDKTINYYTSTWGMGPWIRRTYSPPKEQLIKEGKYCVPFTIKIAATKWGSSFIEVIQPLEGKTIWSDFLATRGEGLHHVCFNVTDWEAEVNEQKKQGAQLLTGVNSDLIKWAYLETKPGGLIIEIKKGGDF